MKTGARVSKRRMVYKGRIFQVEKQTVTLPHGPEVTMDVVHHPGSVVLVPRPHTNSVILIRQYRHVIGRWIWELPAGTLNPGERPAAAARRECEEETGFRPKRVTRLGAYYATPGFCDELMTFYSCEALTRPEHPAKGDEDEQLVPRVFTLTEAHALIASGRVVDMKTVIGLGMIASRRKWT